MSFEINHLKFCLKSMKGSDYKLLTESIEMLQERITILDAQLMSERDCKEEILDKIKGI